MIPRKTLFGNPQRCMARLSPDGAMLAYLAPRDGVMNVWVLRQEDGESSEKDPACQVTQDQTTGIRQFFWAHTNRHILFLQDDNGDEDYHLYSVRLDITPEGKLASGEVIDLTPFADIAAQVVHVSPQHPGEILVGINDRDQHWFHDVYRIDVETGTRELVLQNDQFVGFVADDDLRLRLAVAFTPDSQMMLLRPDEGADAGWSPLMTIGSEDVLTTQPVGLDKTGDSLYLLDSRDRNTAALKRVHLDTGQETVLFATDQADIDGIMVHPVDKTIEAVTYTHEREQHEFLDSRIEQAFERLARFQAEELGQEGDIEVTSRSLADDQWTVAFATDKGPVRYYRYWPDRGETEFLFTDRPDLEQVQLARMHPLIIRSRDGLSLVSYLSLPVDADRQETGRPDRPLPLVLLVHGGPWARDFWGYSSLHQMLANRGYAVLSVNYRGSTGLGKDFINAANLEWAGRMHDDLIDAVQWAVDQKIALPDKVAIVGGSYGGYAALVGLTFTPEAFACGVDIVGPSNLISLMENPPPYWMPIMPLMQQRVGDFTSPEGREFLESRSPLFHVDKICRPLLIGQGAQDPRVKQAESDQVVAAMQEKGIPVSYLLYPEEGHGFDRPANKISFFAVCEAFLAEHLGGVYEPIGDDFEGAKFRVPAGLDGVPGLADGYGDRPD
ncbi:MAG: S9 family peptidase [Mariniblastus sp.]|nr:S9 family peptidase [Mariniblastus sp.]